MGPRTTAGGRGDVTIKDIAARLQISHPTVSRALNDSPSISAETKARVREAAEALGYIRNANAGNLSAATSRLVGFIAPDVQNDFYATCAKVLAERCADNGLQMVLAISEDDPELEYQHVLVLREARAAGVIITPTSGLLDRTAALLFHTLPVVQLVRSSPMLDHPWVGLDDRAGIELATRHLLELGHRRIGFVGGFEALSTGKARRDGYRAALSAFDVPYDGSLVKLGPPRPTFGLQATLDLTASNPQMTGLVLGSSQLTLGALEAFQRNGLRAPKDLSVVGYSDPGWFRIWGPGLTTINLPVEDVAARSAQMLFEALKTPANPGDGARQNIGFQPRLLERGSTARLTGV